MEEITPEKLDMYLAKFFLNRKQKIIVMTQVAIEKTLELEGLKRQY